MAIKKNVIEQFKSILGSEGVLTDAAECLAYSYDNSAYQAMPEIVLLPHNTQEVAQCLALCYENDINCYPRGKGTATTGASLPSQGGLVLSCEQMRKIIEVNIHDRYMVVEPGVTNLEVQQAAKEHGFMWPPDPSSASVCSVGGNLACNAAGPRAIRYGTCRENTLGLTAVLSNGDVIKTGTYTTKGVVGYDLTRLLIGSEGTLAVITQAILKLQPLIETKICLQIFYSELSTAALGITQLMAQAQTPSVLEFMDEAALNLLKNKKMPNIPKDAKAMLMVEIEASATELADLSCQIEKTLSHPNLITIHCAHTNSDINALWQLRKSLSPLLKSIAPKKINEDIVVPVSKLPQYIQYVEKLSKEYQLTIVSFGHAGNGNLHTNIMLDPNNEKQNQNAKICLEKIFDKVLALNGTLSGEHGTGMDKLKFIPKELTPNTLNLTRAIKQTFDPKGILNPGKI